MGIKNQKGFSAIEVVIVLIVLGVIGGAFYLFMGKSKDKNSSIDNKTQNSQQSSSDSVNWQFNNNTDKWAVMSGVAPKCPEPLLKNTPVDTARATSVLYPGQYRDGDYKPHGGLRFDNSKSSDVEVRLPINAKLINITRYIEATEMQYALTFINDCGIMVRFDHVASLTDVFKSLAEKTPAAKVDDTRSNFRFEPPQSFTAGTLVASGIGFPQKNNIAVDFGLYDLRSRNEISKNSKWAGLHADEKEQAYFGVCWLELLPPSHAERVRNLQAGDFSAKSISDYCKTSAGNTLQYNDGKP